MDTTNPPAKTKQLFASHQSGNNNTTLVHKASTLFQYHQVFLLLLLFNMFCWQEYNQHTPCTPEEDVHQ
jgi:zona occludens toxin (predicted ATPase)